jgi:hypothetical protein
MRLAVTLETHGRRHIDPPFDEFSFLEVRSGEIPPLELTPREMISGFQ